MVIYDHFIVNWDRYNIFPLPVCQDIQNIVGHAVEKHGIVPFMGHIEITHELKAKKITHLGLKFNNL